MLQLEGNKKSDARYKQRKTIISIYRIILSPFRMVQEFLFAVLDIRLSKTRY